MDEMDIAEPMSPTPPHSNPCILYSPDNNLESSSPVRPFAPHSLNEADVDEPLSKRARDEDNVMELPVKKCSKAVVHGKKRHIGGRGQEHHERDQVEDDEDEEDLPPPNAQDLAKSTKELTPTNKRAKNELSASHLINK